MHAGKPWTPGGVSLLRGTPHTRHAEANKSIGLDNRQRAGTMYISVDTPTRERRMEGKRARSRIKLSAAISRWSFILRAGSRSSSPALCTRGVYILDFPGGGSRRELLLNGMHLLIYIRVKETRGWTFKNIFGRIWIVGESLYTRLQVRKPIFFHWRSRPLQWVDGSVKEIVVGKNWNRARSTDEKMLRVVWISRSKI